MRALKLPLDPLGCARGEKEEGASLRIEASRSEAVLQELILDPPPGSRVLPQPIPPFPPRPRTAVKAPRLSTGSRSLEPPSPAPSEAASRKWWPSGLPNSYELVWTSGQKPVNAEPDWGICSCFLSLRSS